MFCEEGKVMKRKNNKAYRMKREQDAVFSL
jgi:hypothetical protein